MLSICWADKSSKSTRTTTTAAHNEPNGTTKLTNHSNNLLIISSYNGSLTKVSGWGDTQRDVIEGADILAAEVD